MYLQYTVCIYAGKRGREKKNNALGCIYICAETKEEMKLYTVNGYVTCICMEGNGARTSIKSIIEG